MSTQDLIEAVCKKCRYYQKGCAFDFGDSLTKIPCEALIRLTRLRHLLLNSTIEKVLWELTDLK